MEHRREASLTGGVMRTVTSRRTVPPEIGLGEAWIVNDSIAGLDDKMSQVFEATDRKAGNPGAAFLQAPIDWSSPSAPCRAPTTG